MTPSAIEIQPAMQVDEAKHFVEACNECERICFETANHCLTQGGTLADVRGIQLLRNCARICRTSMASWKVGSRLYRQVLDACQHLCEQCATVCDQITGDRQLTECAEECRVCAEACRRMAEQPTAPGAPFAEAV